MTHTRTIRDYVQQAGDPSVALCVRDQGFVDCCKLWWTSRSWQSQTHAERRLNSECDTTRPWLRLSYAASGKVGLVSVHLCDSGHRASPTSPRLERGVTFGVGQRKERKLLCPTTACTADSMQGGASQWVHVPWGNCASPSPPSQKEGVALLVARTCNEVVPAHKEFLCARQTPVPLISIVCWVLACTAPGTRYASLFFLFSSSGGRVKIKLELPHFHVCIRYMCFNPRSRCNSSSRCCYRAREHVDPAWYTRYAASGTRGSRLEYVQRVLVSYNTAAAAVRIFVVAHIPISLLNFEGVACRIFFTSSANTPKSSWEGNLLFYSEGK